ncbi:MAG: PRD domain-containing protein [Alicyclobacillus herbarius]|uniref:BglG family transcription antiterminator n=1 Tax=Alicyclobacillus herbarius TaxID=122960 RepID=UPI0023567D03|nr:PRD domain-containing protein [Alicyclobacillus herbarius]MCL6633986.1 PRD domain-containing protein [Alicyclobacillus herbarius]
MNRHLSARQSFVLRAAAEPRGVDVGSVAEQLGVSRRTLQRDLRAVQAYLEPFGVKLVSDEVGVWRLAGSRQSVVDAVSGIPRKAQPVPLNPSDRTWLAAVELLTADGPVKLAYLSRRMNLAPASISHLLDGLEDWFAQYGLQLIRRRGYGVEVTGDERQRRMALVELIHTGTQTRFLLTLAHREAAQASSTPAEEGIKASGDAQWQFLIRYLGIDQVTRAYEVVKCELSSFDPPLDEAGFSAFLLHVLIVLARLRDGQVLPERYDIGQARDAAAGRDRKVVARILKRLAPETSGLDAEIDDLAMHLRGAKVQLTEQNLLLPANVTELQFAHRLAESIGQRLNFPLAADKQFTVGLAQHLEPAMHRMATGLSIRNPLLDEVRHRYPDVYAAAFAACREVFVDAGFVVPEAEVGYIAMHAGAALERWRVHQRPRVRIVCPNGISSAELLASRIRAELPQLEIVGIGALCGGNEVDCDFILSTVPWSSEQGVPIVVVSPFLPPEDVDRVREEAAVISAERSEETAFHRGTSVIRADRPRVRAFRTVSAPSAHAVQERWGVHDCPTVRVDVWESHSPGIQALVQEIAGRVEESADSVAEVQEALWQRERQGSVILPGAGLALLHARVGSLHRPYVGVVRLSSPLLMTGVGGQAEPVRTVLVLLARADEPPEVLLQLGQLSRALVEDPKWVMALHTADAATLTVEANRMMKKRE